MNVISKYRSFLITLLITLLICILLFPSCQKKIKKPDRIWIESYHEGIKLAKETKKIALIYFYIPGCKYCKNMENITFKNKEVIKLLKEFICIKINCDKEKNIFEMYKDDILGYPSMLFVDNKGTILNYIIGFSSHRNFIKEIKKVSHKE